jgi:hypothetical protein
MSPLRTPTSEAFTISKPTEEFTGAAKAGTKNKATKYKIEECMMICAIAVKIIGDHQSIR